MKNRSVNLVIKHKDESKLVRRLKIILPIAAIFCLILFTGVYLISVLYVNSNAQKLKNLQDETAQLEQIVGEKKSLEGKFTYTNIRLQALEQILGKTKNFSHLLTDLRVLDHFGIILQQAQAKETGDIGLTYVASSSGSLNTFFDYLLKLEGDKILSVISNGGLSRGESGNYRFSISLKVNPTLLQ